MAVSYNFAPAVLSHSRLIMSVTGIVPKVTQSVLTAAFLFAFKDVLYEQTVKLRRGIVKK